METEWVMSEKPAAFSDIKFFDSLFSNLTIGMNKNCLSEIELSFLPKTISGGHDLRYRLRTKRYYARLFVRYIESLPPVAEKWRSLCAQFGKTEFRKKEGNFILVGGNYGGVFLKDWPHQPLFAHTTDIAFLQTAAEEISRSIKHLENLDKQDRPGAYSLNSILAWGFLGVMLSSLALMMYACAAS